MAEVSIATGVDAALVQDHPSSNYGTAKYPYLRSGERSVLLSMPVALRPGVTVLAATLSVAVSSDWIAQTVSVQAIASKWTASKVTWANQPGVTGSTAIEATGALAVGERFEVDVTALVQAIADGQANYGWRLTTSQSSTLSRLRGFDSGESSFVLDIELSDAPVAPAVLSPQGVVSLSKWVARVEDFDDMAAIQVRVDANQTAAYDFDSGEVATTVPQLDLASTAYAGLADGATTYWQARVKTLDGSWSDWSDWVAVTRHVKPTLNMLSPSGVDIWDNTPDITATLTPAGSSATRWQVLVTAANDPTDVRYDSDDDVTGASLDLTIPAKYRGRVVFPVDGDYRLVVRAWDRPDRVPSFGDRAYVEVDQVVTLDLDALETPPDTLTATQVTTGYPDVVLSWERAADPDKFVVLRDGVRISDVDVDDARIAPGVWEWADRTAPPNHPVEYQVRAVTAGLQSDDSNTATITPRVEGVWLRGAFGEVMLYGDEIGDLRQFDKRTTYELPFRAEDVDIVTAVGGFAGTYEGFLDNRGEQDVDEARALLEALRQQPSAKVLLTFATASVWVRLRGLSVSPAASIILDLNRTHAVRFGCFETEPDD